MAKANPTDKQLKDLTDPSHQIPPGANLKKFKALQAKLLDTAKAVREALPDEPGTAGPLYARIQAAAVEAARVFERRAGVESSAKPAVAKQGRAPTQAAKTPEAPTIVGPVKVEAPKDVTGQQDTHLHTNPTPEAFRGDPPLGPTNTPHPSAAPAG